MGIPNISGDVFPVGLLAQFNGVVQVWNGSSWVTYTGSTPTNVPRASEPLPTYYATVSISASTGLNSANTLVLAAGGASGITATLPPLPSSGSVTVFKSDSAVGAVLVIGFGGSTINSETDGYSLVNQNQYATFKPTPVGWVVTANN